MIKFEKNCTTATGTSKEGSYDAEVSFSRKVE